MDARYGYYAKTPEEKEMMQHFQELLKEGKSRNYYKILLYHFLAGMTNSTEFDDIEVTENYIITIKNGTANIYNKFNSKLTNNEINNIEEILPLEKDDKLYLYLTNKNNEKSVLEYDAKTNKLS